jgi:hypothetical protein
MKIKINPERLKTPIREFYLERLEDESGVSGTGVVARGVVLPSGRVVLEWESQITSITIYNSVDELNEIHGHHGKRSFSSCQREGTNGGAQRRT